MILCVLTETSSTGYALRQCLKLINRHIGVRRKFSWGWFIQWHMVVICICVRCLWRHNLTSYSCFQTNVLAKFV